MTEPREPDAVPEGEPALEEQPTGPIPFSSGNWFPVSAQPSAESGPVEQEPEPIVEPPEVAPEPFEATPEPVEVTPEVTPEAPVEPAEEAPEPIAEVPEETPEPIAEAAPEPVEVTPEVTPEPPVEPAEEVPEPIAEVPEGLAEPMVETPEEVSTDDVEEDPTVSLPAAEFVAPVAVAATERLSIPDEPTSASTLPADAIFRPPSPTPSPTPEPTTMEPLSAEEQKLAAERAARRDARAAALAAPAPEPVAAPRPVVVHKRTNDKFWGSLGLFLLRVVLAGIFTIRGLGILTDIPAAQAEFAKTILADYPPGPQVMAIVTGVASLLIALSLLLGLLTRVAGLGIALIAGGALVLVYWGPSWSPFVPGQPGFLGEYQLLLAAMGILLMCIGGGGWSLDRSFRAGRERDKRERAAETG